MKRKRKKGFRVPLWTQFNLSLVSEVFSLVWFRVGPEIVSPTSRTQIFSSVIILRYFGHDNIIPSFWRLLCVVFISRISFRKIRIVFLSFRQSRQRFFLIFVVDGRIRPIRVFIFIRFASFISIGDVTFNFFLFGVCVASLSVFGLSVVIM